MKLVAPPEGFIAPERVMAPTRLTQRFPWLYPVAVKALQLKQHLKWARSGATWAKEHDSEPFEHKVIVHNSLLMRQLSPEEMELQRNKVVNLRLASAKTNGIVLHPGETFSFNKVVGNCTAKDGYTEGMRLSNGRAISGMGGGICQLANLLHWMVLHSPLTVVERSEHSFDPFPDKGRVLPWGVGCSIVYNYVDLVFRNDTEHTFQILTRVGERYLEGALRSTEPMPCSYKVFAENEVFIKRGEDIFRRNEIWRRVIDKRTGNTIAKEMVKANCARVIYELREDQEVIDADALPSPA